MLSIAGAAAARPVKFTRMPQLTQRGVRALSAWFDETALDMNGIGSGIPAGEVGVAPRKRRVAIFHGYVGSRFKGSQLNLQCAKGQTVEEVLMSALYESGGISGANMRRPFKLGWTRSSRTDKGAHAVCNVIGTDLLLRSDNPWQSDPMGLELATNINKFLPEDVRVFSVQRVTKSFQARGFCRSRTYHYYLPAWMIGMDGSPADEVKLERLQNILNKFVGNRTFHNFTKRSFYQFRHGHRRGWRRARAREKSDGLLLDNADYHFDNAHSASMGRHGSSGNNRGKRHGGNYPSNMDLDDDEDDVEDDDDDEFGILQPDESGDDDESKRNKLSSLRWLEPQLPSDQITSAHYRHIHEFKVVGPLSLSPNSTPAIRFEIKANSFMINQIRHLIGTAICMVRADIPSIFAEVLLAPPARMRFPAVPSETLLLAETHFNPLRPSELAAPELVINEVMTEKMEHFYEDTINKVLDSRINSRGLWESFNRLFDTIFAPNFTPEVVDTAVKRYVDWRARRERTDSSSKPSSIAETSAKSNSSSNDNNYDNKNKNNADSDSVPSSSQEDFVPRSASSAR